ESIGIIQQRLQKRLVFTSHHLGAESANACAEEAAITSKLFYIVTQPPAANLLGFLKQSFQRQCMLAIGQQVVHQQLFNEGLQLGRQLSEENPQILQHSLTGQWPTWSLTSDPAAIDNEQLAICAQQIIQMQIVLPQATCVHPGNQLKCVAQHVSLGIGKHCLASDRAPGIPQAFSAIEPIEQQPSTFTVLKAVVQ